MNRLIDAKRSELSDLCARYHVRRLEVFGSAAGDLFDPNTSDLDFLVEFQDLPPGQYADSYFGLLEELEKVFNRPVDLVMITAVRNPYFLQSIQASRVVLYAA